MSRVFAVLGLVLLVVAVVPGVADADPGVLQASSSCPRPSGSDYPPTTNETDASATVDLESAHLPPGGEGALVFVGAESGSSYSGQVNSKPVPFGPAEADSTGRLAFAFAVPSDFAVNEVHTVELCGPGGSLVLSTSICVDADGTLVALDACGRVTAVLAAEADVPFGGGSSVGGSSAGGVSVGGSSGGVLAFTGGQIFEMLWIAALVLLTGSLLLYLRRRRLQAL